MKTIKYKNLQKLHIKKLKKISQISWKNGWFCLKNFFNNIKKLIQKIPSVNFNERPLNTISNKNSFKNSDFDKCLSLIVIHNISLPPNNFKNKWVEKFFQNKLFFNKINQKNQYKNTLLLKKFPYFKTIIGQEVSAHFYIRRNGKIVQFVSVNKRAWHAGKSNFLNSENCNNFSLGIELSGSDFLPFSLYQYYSLQNLIIALKKHYKTLQYITGHSNIAPNRKTDPGKYFYWQNLDQVLTKFGISKK